MITALGYISAQKAKGTKQTYKDTLWLFNYAATHPDATIWYSASDMILYMNSNTSYLSEPCANSRSGGHYFLSDRQPDMTKPPSYFSRLNVPIHSISRIITNVMGLAAETKTGAT